MRGLIIAVALVLGPVVVIACVDGLATGPDVEGIDAVSMARATQCPSPFTPVSSELDPSVDRNENNTICQKGPALVDDNVPVMKKKAKKKVKKKAKKKAKKKTKKKAKK